MRTVLLSAFFLLLANGCSNAAADVGLPSGGGFAGNGGSAPSDGNLPRTLEFQPLDPQPSAREEIALTVRALPQKVYRVSFSLPTSGGDPLDAVLAEAEVDTDALGFAKVLLTAPSSPTSFQVRASVGSKVAEPLSITVMDRGLCTVRVEPLYVNLPSLRNIRTWIATAHENQSCAQLKGFPPEDGPFPSPPAASDAAPVIPEVPAGKPLAITLRSGYFVGGCTSVESLPPGPVSSPQTVVVPLFNRPIELGGSYLTLSLDLAEPAAWTSLLADAGASVQSGLLGPSADDVDALLDAMRDASGDSRQTFENARKAELWDDALRGLWGEGAATKLRSVTATWLTAGRQRLTSAEHLFVGSLTPIVGLTDDGSSSAKLELQTVGGVPAPRAGFVSSGQVAWSATPDDNVSLGTDLYFVRSQLAAGFAEAVALDADADAKDAAGALATALGCGEIADELAAAGVDAQLAYGSCGAACLTELCEGALVALWNRGADADGLTPTHLSVNATGKAYVGDDAQIAGLHGNWIGELGDEDSPASTGGELSASTPVATP